MGPNRISLAVIILSAWISPAAGAIFDWHEKPYNSSEAFEIKAEFGTNVSLYCHNWHYPETESGTVNFWIRPDLTIMSPGEKEEADSREGVSAWAVSGDGMVMQLTNIDEVHFGFYYCIRRIEAEGKDVVIKKALNYKGAYYGDLWERYQENVIIGGICVGVIIVLVLLACMIDQFCW